MMTKQTDTTTSIKEIHDQAAAQEASGEKPTAFKQSDIIQELWERYNATKKVQDFNKLYTTFLSYAEAYINRKFDHLPFNDRAEITDRLNIEIHGIISRYDKSAPLTAYAHQRLKFIGIDYLREKNRGNCGASKRDGARYGDIVEISKTKEGTLSPLQIAQIIQSDEVLSKAKRWSNLDGSPLDTNEIEQIVKETLEIFSIQTISGTQGINEKPIWDCLEGTNITSPHKHNEDVQTIEAIYNFIETLPKTQKERLLMRMEGYSLNEIAANGKNVTESAISISLKSARAKIVKLLTDAGYDEASQTDHSPKNLPPPFKLPA